MKKKQIISLIAMLVVVLALGGGYAAIKGVNDKKEEAAKEEEEQESETTNVYTINKDDVIGINITNASGNLDIVYKDAAWVSSQGDVPMDSEKVTAMLDAVSSFDAIKVIAENESDLSQYGLDNPSLSYTITTKDGMTYKASFGIVMPTNSNAYYALLDGADKVYTVSANYFEPFNTSLVDMTEIVDEITVNPEYITSYELNKKDGTEFMAKHFDKDETVASSYYTWRIESPYDNVLADTDSFKDVLNVFDGFKFNSCVAYQTEDLSQYGLDKPEATVDLEYYTVIGDDGSDTDDGNDATDNAAAEGSSSADAEATATPIPEESKSYQTVSLSIGNTVSGENKEQCYVSVDGGNNVYLIDKTVADSLTGFTPYSIADKCVYAVLVDQMQGYDVEYNGTKISVVRKEVPSERKDDSDENKGKLKDDGIDNEYYVNGTKVEAESLLAMYSAAYLLTFTGEADETKVQDDADPVLKITYHTNAGKDVVIKYLPYDGDNFYQVDKDGMNYFLTDKRGIDDLISRYENYLTENNLK